MTIDNNHDDPTVTGMWPMPGSRFDVYINWQYNRDTDKVEATGMEVTEFRWKAERDENGYQRWVRCDEKPWGILSIESALLLAADISRLSSYLHRNE